jgi:uncharacterized protein HemX
MSDTKNDIQTSEDAAFEVEADVEDSEAMPTPKRGNGIAWLALLLSGVALAAVAYIQIEDWLLDDDSTDVDYGARIEALDRRIDRSDTSLGDLESRFGQISHPDVSADIDAVRRDVEERIRLLNSLPSRMTTVEDSVASLAGISAGARQTFLLAEAEYYLQIGNAQLQLANNPHLLSCPTRH